MRVTDIIFALICGRIIGFLVGEFLQGWGIYIGLYTSIVLWLALPLFTLFCLWVASIIGQKLLFVFQGSKFLLVGAVATIADLKMFEGLLYVAGIFTGINPLIPKAVSFILATCMKYWGNKYWTFQKHEKEYMHHEIGKFFLVTLGGLLLDVGAFYYCTKISGAEFGIPQAVWLKISVIIAALVAAAFNFLGYKFLVFKK